jgi:hypothetical protein
MYEENDIKPEFMQRPKQNPFRTPDGYFDSMEDRIMGTIEYRKSKKSGIGKVVQFLKPALGLAASFLLIYLLVYYPINTFLLKDSAKVATNDTTNNDRFDFYSFTLTIADENTVVNAVFEDESETVAQSDPDEVLAYLSSRLSDLEIYSEIQN